MMLLLRRPLPLRRLTLHRYLSGLRFSTDASLNGQRLNIVFLGGDEFSGLVLERLEAAHDIWKDLRVVVREDRVTSRYGIDAAPLKVSSERLGLPIHTIPLKKERSLYTESVGPSITPKAREVDWETSLLQELPFQPNADNPHTILVTASFGRILSDKILSRFPVDGALNVHPSLLPAYRGAAPIQRSLMNRNGEGGHDTGVSIISMLPKKLGIDAGSIWGTARVPIAPDATFPSLRDQLATVGGNLLVSVLRDRIAGKARAVPQAHVSSTIHSHARKITFEDAFIDPKTMTSDAVLVLYRALLSIRPLHAHMGSSTCPVSVQLMNVSLASSVPKWMPTTPGIARFSKNTSSVLIRCADGGVLNVERLKTEGKAELDARGWWNGAYSLGWVTENELPVGGALV